jgi:8-oxo-dGTP pyrophosphatase MutT (NUDIX family)/phosphohistidine phosphatase SixA
VTRTVLAAGGVLWRYDDDGAVLVAVVHRPRYDDWSLPKGKLDPGESFVAGAVREVREETGFSCVVGRALGESRYRVLDRGREAPKTVRWWALRATAGQFVPGEETDELRWLTVRSAAALVTAGRDDGVLEAFAAAPADTSTVLLVRHGSAGSRAAWTGPDDARPLDDRGRASAAALAAALPLWGPSSVLSAPPLRCVDTVRPTAQRLGTSVVLDPALAEAARGSLPARLRDLGAAGTSVVACSQGGVVPEAVAALTGGGPVPVRKGSLWALSFAGGRLVGADHTERLDA